MFSFLKKKHHKRLFALSLTFDGMSGYIVEKKDGNYHAVSGRDVVYSDGFTRILDDTDQLLDGLERQTGSRVQEVIYIIPTGSVDTVSLQLLEPYRSILKQVSKGLELKALGYVEEKELPEGETLEVRISKMLQMQDDSNGVEQGLVAVAATTRNETPPADEAASSSFQIEDTKVVDEGPSEVMGFALDKDIKEIKNDKKKGLQAPKLNLKLPKFRKKGVLLALLLIPIGMLAIFIAAETFTHRATVVLTMPFTEKVEAVELTDVAAEKHSEKKDLSATIVTNGKRDTGTKATGEVYVYSFDSAPKSFAAGTKLTSEKLTFVLDEDVTVPAATQSGTSKNAGKAQVKAVAEDFGDESNIEKNLQMSVADSPQSQYFAVSETAFAGGTRKTIRTVSRENLEQVKTKISEAATQSMSETNKSGDGTIGLEDISSVVLGTISYSHDVGDEANELEGTANVDMAYYTISSNVVKEAVKTALAKGVAEGMVVNPETVTFTVKKSTIDDEEKVNITIEAKAHVEPALDKKAVVAGLRGKPTSEVESYLKKTYKAIAVQVKVQSLLNLLNSYVPIFSSNINVQ